MVKNVKVIIEFTGKYETMVKCRLVDDAQHVAQNRLQQIAELEDLELMQYAIKVEEVK